MEKRGVFELSFSYIFIVIVIVLILVFGFKAIGNIMKVGDQVEVADFLSNLNSKINEYYYLDEGSTQKFEFFVPKNFVNICFRGVNPNWDLSGVTSDNHVYFSDPEDNLIVFDKDNSYIDSYKLNREIVTIGSNPLCIQVEGKLKIRLANDGTRATVEEVV